jgi:hypothetical protein
MRRRRQGEALLVGQGAQGGGGRVRQVEGQQPSYAAPVPATGILRGAEDLDRHRVAVVDERGVAADDGSGPLDLDRLRQVGWFARSPRAHAAPA